MPAISPVLALLALFSLAKSQHPNNGYLHVMCYPTSLVGAAPLDFSSLSQSPFPCEQHMYLLQVCTANGTTQIDFLAEQECLCGGNALEAWYGCELCYAAHGWVGFEPAALKEQYTSLSNAECKPTPVTQPYADLFPPYNATSVHLAPDATIVNDRFPNDTRVENYWTGAKTAIAGKITGIATARLTSFTNTDGVRYTPTGSISPLSTENTANPTNPSSPSSTGGATEVRVTGGLLVAIIGALAAL
jgi:hypothetical protein